MLSDRETEPPAVATPAIEAGLTLLKAAADAASHAAFVIPFQQMIEIVPVAVCVCDATGRLVYANRQARDMWQWQQASGADLRVDWFSVVPSGQAVIPTSETPLARVLEGGERCEAAELKLRRPDGSVFDASVNVEPLRDGTRLRGAMLVVFDISARKRAEAHQALLSRLAEQLAGATDQAEIIRVTTALVGEHLGVDRCGFVENEPLSQSVKVIHGWIRDAGLPSLAGRHELQELGDNEWQRRLGSTRIAVADVTANPHTARFAEYYRQRGVCAFAGAPFIREGTWVATLTATTKQPREWREDELGMLDHVVARVWPLVERARAQAALHLVTANAPIVLAYMDRESRIGFANRAFASRWSAEPGDLLGKHLQDVLGEEAFATLRPYVDQVLAGQPVQFELEVPYAKLGRRYIRASYAPDVDADGTVRGYLSAVSDITERRAMEHAVQQSEERFRALAQHAPVGIFQTDRQGQCVFVNHYWSRMAGVSLDDAQAMGWVRAVHPDDRVRVQAAWQDAVEKHTVFALEHRLLRSDGQVIWVQASSVEFRDPEGVLLGYIGTVIDVTERKAAEFALRESEKRFRLVASRAPVGIFMTNEQGETMYVNPSWCNMAGLTPEQAQGLGWINSIHPDDRQRVLAEWEAAVQSGISSKAEYRFVRADGTVTWVHGHAVQVRDASGRLSGYIGTIADFTERKQAELAMRDSEERFRMLADNIAQFAWICDGEGRYSWVNRRFLQYAGATLDEMNRGAGMAMHHPDHYARVVEKFRAHLASGEPWEDSFPLRGRDGGYRWFLSRAIPIHDSTGRITRWFGTNTDITDLRNTQEMLRKAQAELLAHTTDLERKIETRTASLRDAIVQMEEFSYSVSHDLRAPLRAMNGYAEALMEDYGPQLDETARDYVRRIQRSSQRMEKLTYDVLTYSRLARSEIVLVPIDLAAVLRDLIGQYAELQPASADLIVDEPLHRVLAHEVSLGQCLGNLLTNAAKFVAPGVRPRIRVFTTLDAGQVRIWVVDNGIGIRPEFQKNLFQIFERIPTAVLYEGTGIGLAIVRKAAEKMGGRCGVESDGVSGCRFWVELGAADA